MTVNTKYNINDTVYFMQNDEIYCGKVNNILINNNKIIYSINHHPISRDIEKIEEDLYLSPESCANSLLYKYKRC